LASQIFGDKEKIAIGAILIWRFGGLLLDAKWRYTRSNSEWRNIIWRLAKNSPNRQNKHTVNYYAFTVVNADY